MTTQTKASYLVISTLGSKQVAHLLIHLATDMGCQVEESHLALLGQEYSLTALLSGNWGAIAKLETALPHFKQKYAIDLFVHRTELAVFEHEVLNYLVQVVSHYRPELLEQVTQFFVDRKLPITELYSTNYLAHTTHTRMLSINLTVQIPIDDSIAELREQFMIFCDDLNIDGILEAER